MPITDVPNRSESVQQAADQLRRSMAHLVRMCEAVAQQVKMSIDTHTKAALVAELGSDAAQFTNSYMKLKNLIETADTTKTVPNI